MKIVFIAPLPPPVTGQSLASIVLMEGLQPHHEVLPINLSKDSLVSGVNNYKRFLEIWQVLKKIAQTKKSGDVLYLTISESLAGNLKDLLVYLICFRKLNKMFIHIHGGSIRKLLFDKHPVLKWINSFFIKRMKGVIVLGESHLDVFEGIIEKEKVHILPNFSLDHLFLDEQSIRNKYKMAKSLNVLYLSHLIDGKGYNDLLDAYILLDESQQNNICLEFAGGFASAHDEQVFLNRIAPFPKVRYHGVADGDLKKRLLHEAHVLCLPTKYFEGQPVVILEAYASGCNVVTTGKPGILDVFTPGINGFLVDQDSPQSIKNCIDDLINKYESMEDIGVRNHTVALEKYTVKQFVSLATQILLT